MKKIVLSIDFNPSLVVKVIGAIIGFTILVSAITVFFRYSTFQHDLFGLASKFDMDAENTVPTFISSMNLLIAAGLLGFIAYIIKRRDGKHWKQWSIMGIIFFILALDETSSFHEGVASRFNVMVGGMSGTTHYAWAILGSVLILGFLVYFSRFIFSLPASTRNRFVMSGVIFLGGAIGVEALGGYISTLTGYDSMFYHMSVVAEESMEMLGIYLFIWSLFRYVGESLVVAKESVPERAILRIKPEVEVEEEVEHFGKLAQERA